MVDSFSDLLVVVLVYGVDGNFEKDYHSVTKIPSVGYLNSQLCVF